MFSPAAIRFGRISLVALSVLVWAHVPAEGVAQETAAEAARQAGLDSLRQGRFADAADAYGRALALDPASERTWLELADIYIGAGLPDDANRILVEARTRFPESRSPNYNLLFFDLAELFVRLGRMGMAAEAMAASAEVPGPVPEARVWKRLGDFLTDLLRLDEALAAYEGALELDPGDGATQVALGNLYLRRNELDRAMAHFTGMLDSGWDGPDIHHGIAEVHWRRGEFGQAVLAADRVLRADSGHRGALYIRGSALIRLGSRESGQMSLDEYRRLDAIARSEEHRRRDLQTIRSGAMDLVRQRRYEEAIRVFERGVESYPLNHEMYLGLGQVQSEAGLHQEALGTFRRWLDMGLDEADVAYEYLVRESGFLAREADPRVDD